MHAFGPAEIGVILILGLLMVGMPIALVALLVFISRRSGQSSKGSWKAPIPAGSPTQIRALTASDHPIAPSASWHGSELVVQASEWSTKSLFDVPLAGLGQCLITYRFSIMTDNPPRAVYPEMWCRVPEKGQFFSRGVDRKIRGSVNWTEVEIPFFLQNGQKADLLHLNLVFEGPGQVRMKNIEVLSTPVKSSN